MTTEVMPAEKQRQRVHHESKPAVKMMIAAARSSRVRAPAQGAWGLSGLTAILLWASFTPLDWGPLAWIALVPLILLIRIPIKTRWMYTAVYGGGFTFSLFALQWMRLASAPMYVAWLLLAVYVAIYLPVFVAVSRIAVHRFNVPLTLAVPAVWVGLEYCRAYLLTGFSWYYLGHTQYRWVEMIQISDLVGAYGVSFVVAMLSACVAGLLPTSLFARLKLLPAGLEQPVDGAQAMTTRQITAVSVCLVVFAAVWGYGTVRRGQANFVEGPSVGLVQGNFTSSTKHDSHARMTIFMKHHTLTGIAVRQHPLDLIVWPETMYRTPLMSASPDLTDDDLRRISPASVLPEHWRTSQVPEILANLSSQAGAAMIVGLERWTADADGFRRYNSATFTRPDVGLSSRYDKIHRVIFGEYVPWQDELPWLAKLSPIPTQYGLSAGKAAAVFEYKGVRYSPIICFEDTVPQLVRSIAKSTVDPKTGKPIDCFVNLTNDGWFHGSSELDQHLITALFRCVECRTPMVRAVNTGISAVIDGDGVVVEPDDFIDADKQGRTSMRDPKTGRWHKQLNAVVVDAIPLDDRRSLYVRCGDWFAGSCAMFAGCVFLGGMFPRRKHPK